jgi:hypothetical protein
MICGTRCRLCRARSEQTIWADYLVQAIALRRLGDDAASAQHSTAAPFTLLLLIFEVLRQQRLYGLSIRLTHGADLA